MIEYLHVGNAGDLVKRSDRLIYRLLEIFPGFLAWSTLILIFIGSWLIPTWMTVFIIIFDLYWLIKAIFVSLHMRSSFKKMRANIERNWLKDLPGIKPASPEIAGLSWQDMYHLVIVPFSIEPLPVIREALTGIAKSDYPMDKIIVALGTEERVGQSAQDILRQIQEEFGNVFLKLLTTTHPDNIPGELKGKSANIAWTCQKAKAEIIDSLKIPDERVIVSIFDSDTVVPHHYFGCLTYNFLTCEKPLRSGFQPIPLYINNIWQAPAFARVFSFSTTFWQMIQQARPERMVSFSSQSISLRALIDIGYWQTNIVSEDSRIYWQCLLRYDGDWRAIPMYYPVYMDANVAPTWMQTFKNQYKQIRRWAWGVENNPYFLFGFLKNKKIPWRQKLSVSWFMTESSHSLATNSFIIFLLGWLPLVLGGNHFYGTILSYNLPIITRDIMNLAMLGLVSSAILSVMLLPPRPPNYGKFKILWIALQWILFPVNLVFFGAVPSLDAQTRLMLGKYMGFWVTPKSRN